MIAPTPEEKERLAEYRDNVESAMQAKFSDIVDEVPVLNAGRMYLGRNVSVNYWYHSVKSVKYMYVFTLWSFEDPH